MHATDKSKRLVARKEGEAKLLGRCVDNAGGCGALGVSGHRSSCSELAILPVESILVAIDEEDGAELGVGKDGLAICLPGDNSGLRSLTIDNEVLGEAAGDATVHGSDLSGSVVALDQADIAVGEAVRGSGDLELNPG